MAQEDAPARVTWDELHDLGVWVVQFATPERRRDGLERYRELLWRRALEIKQ